MTGVQTCALPISLREVQHALVAVEILQTTQQLLSGMVTTQEALDAMTVKLMGLPRLQVGDIDLITGLRTVAPGHVEVEAAMKSVEF